MVPGILIIGSLPESDAEAGGERGKAAFATTRKGVWPCATVVVGRVEATNLFNVTVRTPLTVKVVKSEEHWDAEVGWNRLSRSNTLALRLLSGVLDA